MAAFGLHVVGDHREAFRRVTRDLKPEVGSTVERKRTVRSLPGGPVHAPPGFVVSPAYSNGTFQVTFAGASNTAYTAQWAVSVTGSWSFFQTVTAGTDGLIQVTDTRVPPVASRYYRIMYP